MLIIPAYLSQKSKLQRLLLITTRISQKEAEIQISLMNYFYQLVSDIDENYLNTPLNPHEWLNESRSQD
jgi:tryptophan synthase alpha subunit